jgi:hypothetical protein
VNGAANKNFYRELRELRELGESMSGYRLAAVIESFFSFRSNLPLFG